MGPVIPFYIQTTKRGPVFVAHLKPPNRGSFMLPLIQHKICRAGIFLSGLQRLLGGNLYPTFQSLRKKELQKVTTKFKKMGFISLNSGWDGISWDDSPCDLRLFFPWFPIWFVMYTSQAAKKKTQKIGATLKKYPWTVDWFMVVNNPLIRAYLLGGVALAG